MGGTAAQNDFEMRLDLSVGVHVAVVESTPRREGEADPSCCGGRLRPRVNPMLVEGQIHGGIAQGAAKALYEAVVFDEEGNPLTSSLATYGIPSSADLPSFVSVPLSTLPAEPMGAKGIGEGGPSGQDGGPQAVIDALSHLVSVTSTRR